MGFLDAIDPRTAGDRAEQWFKDRFGYSPNERVFDPPAAPLRDEPVYRTEAGGHVYGDGTPAENPFSGQRVKDLAVGTAQGLAVTPSVIKDYVSERSPTELAGDAWSAVKGVSKAVGGLLSDPSQLVTGIPGDISQGYLALDQAKRLRDAGDHKGANKLEAMGGLLLAGVVAGAGGGGEKVAKEGIEAAVERSAAEQLAQASAGRSPAQTIKQPVKNMTRNPERVAIGQAFDGVTDYDKAMDMARKGVHLQQGPDGQYIGGPRVRPDASGKLIKKPVGSTVDSPRALRNQRDATHEIVVKGLSGADWYDRVRNEITEVADDPRMQSLLARGGAAYSPQATPPTETNAFLRQHNAKVVSNEDLVPRMRTQAENVNRAYGPGNDGGFDIDPTKIRLGRKTGPYGDAKDPTVDPKDLYKTANDIWHGRATGYSDPGGRTFSRAFTPQEHGYLTGENLLMADRAEKSGLRPPDASDSFGWTPRSVQAATWVGQRIGDETAKREAKLAAYDKKIEAHNKRMERWAVTKRGDRPKKPTRPNVKSDEEIFKAANAGIDDAIQGQRAFQTYEWITGENTGILKGLNAADEGVRKEYSDKMQAIWGNSDPLMESLQAYHYPTQEIEGHFTNSAGEVEHNQAYTVPALVGNKSGGRVDDASTALMDGTAAVRSVIGGQEGVGWNRFHPATGSMKADDKTGVRVTGTREQIENAKKALEAEGLETVDLGHSLHVGRFMNDWSGRDVQAAVKRVHQNTPFEVEAGRFESNLQSPPWTKKEGTGRVSKWFTKQLTRPDIHNYAQRLDAEGVPEKLRQQTALKREYADLFPTRQDELKFADLIGEQGFAKYLDYVKQNGHRGLPAALPFAGLLGQEQDEQK